MMCLVSACLWKAFLMKGALWRCCWGRDTVRAHWCWESLQMFCSHDKNNLFCLSGLNVCVRVLCMCLSSFFTSWLCVCVCVQGCLWGRNPAWSWVIRHAALVTGNGVSDGQAKCIIDECRALAALSPCRISLNFLSEWQKKPRTISLIQSICLTAPYPFNPPIQ